MAENSVNEVLVVGSNGDNTNVSYPTTAYTKDDWMVNQLAANGGNVFPFGTLNSAKNGTAAGFSA